MAVNKRDETYCPHGYVLPQADHPSAGLETCPHGCCDTLFMTDEEWAEAEAEAKATFGF